jgi:hypothetical protein
MVYLCSQCTLNVILSKWWHSKTFVRHEALLNKTCFETWITRDDVCGISLFQPSLFKNTYGLPVFTMHTTCPNQVFYEWLVDLQTICAKSIGKRESLQIIKFVHVCSTWGIVELKMPFETWITRNDLNGVRLFHLPYLITLTFYQCSQWTPHFQIKYSMFDWYI